MDEDICPFRDKYLDELMIPQLLEIASYGVDGVWVDGDCWGVKVGYHPDVIKAFEEKYSVSISDNPPQKYGDPYYEEYREFHREAFRKNHLERYINAVHEKYPDFQIASNEILPIPSLKLTLKKKPKKAIWQPENKKLKVFKNGNSYFVSLPPLHIHSIVEITFYRFKTRV